MGPVSASARLTTAGITLMGLGTSTLVYLAVTHHSPASGGPLPSATSVESPLTDSPTSDASSIELPPTTPTPVFGGVLLDAVSATVAWRITNDSGTSTGDAGGGCTSFRHPSSASASMDAGATWTAVDVPFTRVVQLRAQSPQAASVIGSDGDCAAGFASTSDGGVTWTKRPVPTDIWYVDARDFTTVHIGVTSSKPCGATVRQLSTQTSARAAVLCSDGGVRATADGGKTWANATAAKGTVAVAASGDTWLVAVRGAPGCAGLSIQEVGATTAHGCVGIGASGPAALFAVDPQVVWAATPATSAVSTDGGASWPY